MRRFLLLLLLCAQTVHAERLVEFTHPVQEFLQFQSMPAPMRCDGRRVQLDIDASGIELLDVPNVPNVPNVRIRALYRMGANQVTEGWNWHPDSAREGDDYYHYKYLPLLSVEEARGNYRGEDKIGVEQEFRVHWRYDYFFAFDNLYDFFARQTDDDAGFIVTLSGVVPLADLGMMAVATLAAPCISESTTFWKAIHARPVDFTLKKRYLLGKLEAVVFFDRRTGVAVGQMNKFPARQ